MSWHQFLTENGDPYGSFEVFFTCGSFNPEAEEAHQAGWYWVACFPGCLPDSEPVGPFSSEAEATANGEAGE